MPKIEWETRYLRLAARVREREPQHPLAARTPEPAPVDVTFTDALHAYIKQVLRRKPPRGSAATRSTT